MTCRHYATIGHIDGSVTCVICNKAIPKLPLTDSEVRIAARQAATHGTPCTQAWGELQNQHREAVLGESKPLFDAEYHEERLLRLSILRSR
jgi:hypothetical protein